MKEITNLFGNIKDTLPTIAITDIIDILLVAFVIYKVITLIRSTSAARIAKAIILLLLLTLVTDLVRLNAMKYLLDKILELGFVALVIVFQPELRRMLERLGGSSFRDIVARQEQTEDMGKTIDECVRACEMMSKERVGALIAFERKNSLEQTAKGGTVVDAEVSQELIRNIFFPKAALHDGAMIIRGTRIVRAGCVLPLSENRNLSSDLGTRHRAGVGMSEVSDAVVLIVSEETGTISVAVDGMLKRHLAAETLRKLLQNELMGGEKPQMNFFTRLRSGKKKGDGENGPV